MEWICTPSFVEQTHRQGMLAGNCILRWAYLWRPGGCHQQHLQRLDSWHQKGIPPKSGLHDLLSLGVWAMKSICLMVKPQCLKSQCLILLKGEILQTRKVCRIFVGSLPPELFVTNRPAPLCRPVNGLGWSCGIHHTSASRSKLRPDTTVNGWKSGIQNLRGKKTRLQTVRWNVSKQECL